MRVALLTILIALSGTGAASPGPRCPERSEMHWTRVDVVFVLDTTGSMGGMLAGAKRKIWSIAAAISRSEPAPELRMGLLAYRDRGDEYVTRSFPLVADLDLPYERLLGLQAAGGGDGPESVNQALHEALDSFREETDGRTLRLLFLVGDAPPHMYGGRDVPYSESSSRARRIGVQVHTLQCGDDPKTEEVWRTVASGTGGTYLRLPPSGGARTIVTPYDDQLALHSSLLDQTRHPYGGAANLEKAEARRERSEEILKSAPAEALADRAVYRGTGALHMAVGDDLVSDLAAGAIRLEDIPEAELPASLRQLAPERRQLYLERLAERQRGLLEEIGYFAEERRRYVQKHISSPRDSFDTGILELLRCHGLGVAD